MNTVAQKYQNNQVTTASPAELTLLLYNGAIKFIKQARSAILDKQLDKANHSNIRVQDIIMELMVTLNRNYPISEEFLIMYDYMLRRMVEANLHKDVAVLDEVEDLFIQFRDAWKEAMTQPKKQG